MSVATQTPKLEAPEPYEFADGWRVDAACLHCGATVYLDSETKPGELGMKFLGSISCDHCLSEQEAAADRNRLAVTFDARLDRSGLPRNLRELAWGDMDRGSGRRQAIVAGRAWSESSSGLMLLFGPVGTGKTRLAATACWERLQHGECLWVSVPILLQIAFAERQSPEKARAAKVLANGTVPLVLDDLGKEKPGDWARQVLFGAIDARIQAGTPLLVTSNFDPDELADRLGQAVGSRLVEFHQFELGGRDRREAPKGDIAA